MYLIFRIKLSPTSMRKPDMSDKSRKRALEKGLTSKLLDSLQYQDVPTGETLAGFVGRLKRMDERIPRRKEQTRPRPPPLLAWHPRTPGTLAAAEPLPPGAARHRPPYDCARLRAVNITSLHRIENIRKTL